MIDRHRTRRHGSDGIVITGGGLAAQRCVETLRREGCEQPIRVVCDEPHRPYDRPPLSKNLLIGDAQGSDLAYRSADWYAERSIDLHLGVGAKGLEPAARRLTLTDGAQLRYDRLLIATGGRPRSLPLLAGYDNVSTLRTVDDALGLREALRPGSRLAVIGAGFIGLEVAATARRLGVEVTLVEAAARPLAGILGERLACWFASLHRSEGVELHTGVTVDRVIGDGSVRALRVSNGTVIDADHVVVGVGIEAAAGWLAGSGLEWTGGVPVDLNGATASEQIFAAGDAAATFDAALGRHIPGSHWEAAARQGARAARMMLGLDPGPAPAASFWSDQYGIRIQYVGRARPTDTVAIDGELESRNFTATYHRAGRAVAVLLVGRPRALPAARTLIEKGTP